MARIHNLLDDSHWGSKQTSGSVWLTRRWMKRHTWTEESRPWTWVHDLSKVLLSCGPLIAVPQALRGYELCRPAAGTPGQSRLAHVLREGWRASCWGAFLGSSSRAAEALRHLCWAEVATSAKGVSKYVAQHPPAASDHYVSRARFHSNQGLPVPACSCGDPCPDRAHEWTCAFHCGTDVPTRPVGVLQATLAWPSHRLDMGGELAFLGSSGRSAPQYCAGALRQRRRRGRGVVPRRFLQQVRAPLLQRTT